MLLALARERVNREPQLMLLSICDFALSSAAGACSARLDMRIGLDMCGWRLRKSRAPTLCCENAPRVADCVKQHKQMGRRQISKHNQAFRQDEYIVVTMTKTSLQERCIATPTNTLPEKRKMMDEPKQTPANGLATPWSGRSPRGPRPHRNPLLRSARRAAQPDAGICGATLGPVA